jgi:hypothetical protein
MASTATSLDLSALPIASRREVRDFYLFLLARRGKVVKAAAAPDVERRFTDLCGSLSWKGDAVAAQRSLRDEW